MTAAKASRRKSAKPKKKTLGKSENPVSVIDLLIQQFSAKYETYAIVDILKWADVVRRLEKSIENPKQHYLAGFTLPQGNNEKLQAHHVAEIMQYYARYEGVVRLAKQDLQAAKWEKPLIMRARAILHFDKHGKAPDWYVDQKKYRAYYDRAS